MNQSTVIKEKEYTMTAPEEAGGTGTVTYSASRGLTEKQAAQSARLYGTNSLGAKKKTSFIKRFFSNFSDPIIRILLASCAVNAILNFRNINRLEIGGILAAVFIATFVSALSEHSSQGAFEKLCARAEEKYEVTRGGRKVSLAHSEIVTGDIVHLRHGEVIPCDGIMLNGELRCDQSPLTGESRPVSKLGNMPLQGSFLRDSFTGDTDNTAYVFSGCGVISGEGDMLCIRVGRETYFGSVAESLSEEKSSSPMKERLSALAKRISIIGYIGAALVAAAYLINVFFIDAGASFSASLERLRDVRFAASSLLSALTLAVSVLVVAVPEGLPMMITVVLSSNMKRMIKKNVLVRRMVGIETSGSLSVLFCDKTGTLTEGRMGVTSLILPDAVISDGASLARDPLLLSCVLAPAPSSGQNPTDLAFTSFATGLRSARVIRRLPFESARRFSAAAVASGENGRVFTVIRGAPELLAKHISYIREGDTLRRATRSDIDEIRSRAAKTASGGGRVLLLCAAEGNRIAQMENGSPGELIYLAAAELSDPLRRDAAESVKEAQSAGIQVVMVTGDSAETACYVARRCGILTDGVCISGEEVRRKSDAELDAVLPELSVVYRALPSDKLRLVERAQAVGMVAGMTGDGVNDAPSLSRADVGFAMGSGSDVAAAAADIVILDSGLKSIVSAVMFGRTIFKSIRKFIFFQLSMNLCATLVSFLGPFIGVDSPVTVVQMLWINMIMDTLGALAFAGEAPEERYLRERPIKRSEGLITRQMLVGILMTSSFMTAVCIAFLKVPFFRNALSGKGDVYFLTVFFVIIIFLGIFLSFSVRTDRLNPLAGLSKNPTFAVIMTAASAVQFALVEFGGNAIRCVPLETPDVLRAVALASLVLPADFIRKTFLRLFKRD